jgi:hypothetical protein
MAKIINTKDLSLKEILNSLYVHLKKGKEEVHIYYKDSRELKKLESEILSSFDEHYFESGRIKFIKYK